MPSAKGKQALDAALVHLKQQADEAKARLEARQRSESWVAFKTALQESQAAFDKSSQKSLEKYEVDPFTFIQNL